MTELSHDSWAPRRTTRRSLPYALCELADNRRYIRNRADNPTLDDLAGAFPSEGSLFGKQVNPNAAVHEFYSPDAVDVKFGNGLRLDKFGRGFDKPSAHDEIPLYFQTRGCCAHNYPGTTCAQIPQQLQSQRKRLGIWNNSNVRGTSQKTHSWLRNRYARITGITGHVRVGSLALSQFREAQT